MIMYGIRSCIDTVEALKIFDANGVSIDYRDFNDDIRYLKEFLQIRDQETELFAESKEAGGIGIPCYVLPDGTYTLDTAAALRTAETAGKK